MDARTSRYHEVYARWQRDPQGFWAEAAQAIDWIEPAEAGVRSDGRRVRPLVRGRRVQHLLERRRPPRDARSRRAAGDHLRFTGRRPEADDHLRTTCRSRPRCWPRSCGISASAKGDRVIIYMPMVPEAAIAMLACARIGAVHSVVFGGFARQGARHPHRRCQAEGHPLGELRHRARPRRPVQAAARRGDRALHPQARRLPHPAAPAGGGRAGCRPRPRLGEAARRGDRVRALGLRLRAGRRHRSALHPLHLGHDRASRRAWCATMAATWSRSSGR